MDFVKKQPGFLYLDKNGFYFYETGLTLVVSLAFLSTSVRDMDVVNGSSLINQIKSFVDQYQLAPASIAVILSPNITFEKDFMNLGREAVKEGVDKFLDTVPFESALSKEYAIEKGVKVIAANDDIYRELKLGFEKCFFSIDSVIPYQMLGQDQALIRNLTTENATQLLKRVDHLKQFNMISVERNKTITQNIPEKKGAVQSKKPKVRLYAMIGIFVALFAILGIMLLRM